MSQDTIIIISDLCPKAKTKFIQLVASHRQWFWQEHFKCKCDRENCRTIFIRAWPEDTENAVKKRINDSHADNDHIAGILYFQGNTDSKPGSGFLGLTQDFLSRKCVIVTTGDVFSSAKQVSEKCLETGRGFRTIHFDGTHKSALSAVRLLVDEPSPLELPSVDVAPSITPEKRSPSMTPSNDSQKFREDNLPEDRNLNQLAYEQSGLSTLRHSNQAIVLTVGQSGHGKSTTINRLVGHNLLDTGRSTTGSTTKVIQRATIPVHDDETGIEVTIAFDDTPGYVDTTYSHQTDNAALMREYKRIFFPDSGAHLDPRTICHPTFPNVILLVAAWDSITPDAHNEPGHFTSSLGKSMFNLTTHGLVDPARSNVIVVITKSMSSWDQFDDIESEEGKKAEWNTIAANGSPLFLNCNARLSRNQLNGPSCSLRMGNLFNAICDVIAPRNSANAFDLAGIQALRLLSGGGPLYRTSKFTRQVLLSEPLETITPETPQDKPNSGLSSFSRWRPSGRIGELVNEYLGVTYNPVSGSFGRTCIIRLGSEDVKIIDQSGGQSEGFEQIKNSEHDIKTTATQLHVEFEMRDVAGLSSHYSSSHTFKATMSTESQFYRSQHVISVAKVTALSPRLSQEMVAEINRLPRLLPTDSQSTELMDQYYDFFQRHGTHVVLCVALGGLLRVVSHANSNTKERIGKTKFTADGHVAPNPADILAGASLTYTREREKKISRNNVNITICRDGGAVVASQLTRVLEEQLRNSPSPTNTALSGWTDVRTKWVDALGKDPVFCPDSHFTQYQWLYNMDGLTLQQKYDMKLAAKSYLMARPGPLDSAPNTNKAIQTTSLPREENHHRVFGMFKNAKASIQRKLHWKAKEDSV